MAYIHSLYYLQMKRLAQEKREKLLKSIQQYKQDRLNRAHSNVRKSTRDLYLERQEQMVQRGPNRRQTVIVSEFLENIYKNKPENVIFTNIFDHCMVVYTVFRKYITEDTVSITVDSKKAVKDSTCIFTCRAQEIPYEYMATVYNNQVVHLYGSDFTIKTSLNKDGTVVIKVIRM